MTKGLSSLWLNFSSHSSCVLRIHSSLKPVLIPSQKIFGTAEVVKKCGTHLNGLSDEAVARLIGAKNIFLNSPLKVKFDDNKFYYLEGM